jgi:hypothetical protein
LSKKWARPFWDTLPYVARNAFGWRWTIFGQFWKSFKKKLKKSFEKNSFFSELQNCPKNGQGHFGTRFHMLRGMHSVGDGRFLDNFGKLKKFWRVTP